MARADVVPDLPGREVVEAGLADLRAGHETPEALVLLEAAPRLCRAGLDLPAGRRPAGGPRLALYRALARRHGDAAHGRMNALLRRVLSFARALETSSAA